MDQDRENYDGEPGPSPYWPPPLWALGFMVPWAIIVAGTVLYILFGLITAFSR